MSLWGRKRYQARQQAKELANAERLAEHFNTGYGVGVDIFEAGGTLNSRPEPGSDSAEAYEQGVRAGYAGARKQQAVEYDWAVRELAKAGIRKLERMLAGELPDGWDDGELNIHGGGA
jgi:hypothetical protein